jgi:hypothetical protein
MRTLLRTMVLGALFAGSIAATAFTTTASAEEAKSSGLKKGDTVHVCGCGEGCHCGSIAAAPGKCGCGKDLVKATVASVEGTTIKVDRGGTPGETTFKAAYKCGCGEACKCNTVALAPGKCHCGKDLVKVN